VDYNRAVNPPFTHIDHVQLAIPTGGEPRARDFYGRLLGMIEVPKPTELAKRGGAWFTSGGVEVHLGVEADFRAARKAHPAFRCSEYESLLARLRAAGVVVHEDNSIPGVRRCHLHDPFGNRLELISA
jgi:catechol 2,3-dioxygenase-like lactoylglutathione lyase family enzyme